MKKLIYFCLAGCMASFMLSCEYDQPADPFSYIHNDSSTGAAVSVLTPNGTFQDVHHMTIKMPRDSDSITLVTMSTHPFSTDDISTAQVADGMSVTLLDEPKGLEPADSNCYYTGKVFENGSMELIKTYIYKQRLLIKADPAGNLTDRELIFLISQSYFSQTGLQHLTSAFTILKSAQ